MTRRGSIAYYLAAWICGCVFMSVAAWAYEIFGIETATHDPMRATAGLLFAIFYGLIGGAVPALLGAFLLRRLMKMMRWRGAVRWIVAGSLLAPSLILMLGSWEKHMETGLTQVRLLFFPLLMGPMIIFTGGWWLAIPAGAATAWVLQRIESAFAPENN